LSRQRLLATLKLIFAFPFSVSSPSSGECTELSHRIAIEVYLSSAVSLAIALATTIFVSIDLHIHRWLGLFPTPRPAEQGWPSRPLLPTRRDGEETGWRKSERRRKQPIFAYSDEEDSQSPLEDSPRPTLSRSGVYPPSNSTSYPPAPMLEPYIARAKAGLPLTPSLASDVSPPSAPSVFTSEPSLRRQASLLPPPRYSTINRSRNFDVGTFFSPGKHDSSKRYRHGGSTSDETAPSTRTAGTSRPSESETEEDTEEEAARIKAEEEKKAHRRRRAARRKREAARKKATGSSHHHHHHHHIWDSSSHHDDDRYKRKRKQAGLNATSSGAQSAVNSALLNSGGGGGDAGGGESAS
jgi:hypothetical protein